MKNEKRAKKLDKAKRALRKSLKAQGYKTSKGAMVIERNGVKYRHMFLKQSVRIEVKIAGKWNRISTFRIRVPK